MDRQVNDAFQQYIFFSTNWNIVKCRAQSKHGKKFQVLCQICLCCLFVARVSFIHFPIYALACETIGSAARKKKTFYWIKNRSFVFSAYSTISQFKSSFQIGIFIDWFEIQMFHFVVWTFWKQTSISQSWNSFNEHYRLIKMTPSWRKKKLVCFWWAPVIKRKLQWNSIWAIIILWFLFRKLHKMLRNRPWKLAIKLINDFNRCTKQ